MAIHNLFLHDLLESERVTPAEAERIAAWASKQQDPLGIIAVEHGLIVGRQIEEVLERQRVTGLRFGETGVSMGYLTDTNLSCLLEIQQIRGWNRVLEVVMLSGLLSSSKALMAFSGFIQRREAGTRGVPCGERLAA